MVKHIHTLSSGYPGRVNRVAQQVLVDMANYITMHPFLGLASPSSSE